MTETLARIEKSDVASNLPPREILAAGTEMAQALQSVINGKKNPVRFGGEQYLELEDWLTLSKFFDYEVLTGEVIQVTILGVEGFKAIAKVFRKGELVGGAEAFCMRDEPNWKGKPTFQLASMAQTRAAAKALRNKLAWVAVLAGYRPTPAEEMDATTHEVREASHTKPHCDVCGAEASFVKAGKVKQGPRAGQDYPAFWICKGRDGSHKWSIKDAEWQSKQNEAPISQEREPGCDDQ